MNGNVELVSFCGLYCGSCKRYLKGSCPGCKNNVKATWCKTRTCNMQNGYKSCADCKSTNFRDCKINNNIISKAFGLVFNTDRLAGLELIRDNGYDAFAQQMTDLKQVSVKRRK